MKKVGLWAIGTALVIAALVGVAVVTGWVDDYREATLFLAGVAAVSGLAGVIITWLGDRSSERHLRELAVQQEQAASDIRRLAELTESSLEEARAQKPEPVVEFIYGKERASASSIVVTRRRFARSLEIETMVAAQRQAALATLPPEEPELEDEMRKLQRRGLGSVLTAALAGLDSGPITPEERQAFEQRVDEYERKLKTWLHSYENYRRETDPVFPLTLRFENRGRVPARGVRVVLHFPGGFEHADRDELPLFDKPPGRPRFVRPRRGFPGLPNLSRALTMPDYSRMLRDVPAIAGRRNVSAPRYRKGSLIVEIDVEVLRHGLFEESDVLWLKAETDGEFTIPWEMHAENLGEPARGELGLQIVTELEEGPPITGVAEMRWPEEDVDEEDG
jgi:hypothetical protein